MTWYMEWLPVHTQVGHGMVHGMVDSSYQGRACQGWFIPSRGLQRDVVYLG
jgi:hypothetical protein